MNLNLVSFLSISIFFLTMATSATSEPVLNKIQRTGVLNVAIREDAPPFGYLDANNNQQGYCLDFFALLKQQLTEKLERNTLSTKLFKSTPANRFTLVSNTVDLECGPNTIRSDIPKNISFSTGFFVTGTQFLIKRENKNRLDLKTDLDGAKLGVISNTTTADFIAKKYPGATIQKYAGLTARTRGIQAVEQNKIDAMISDGILLRAVAQQQELSSKQYPLVPKIPLTCDRYGMIIKGNDPQWRDFVDSVINSPEAASLSNAWFGQLYNYTLNVKDFCQQS